MANAYGRGGAEMAQRGPVHSAYDFSPTSAMERLRGTEGLNYRAAMNMLNKSLKMNKRGKVKRGREVLASHKMALDRVERLRNLAAERAFEDFTSSRMQTSKPWLVKADEGLISGETIDHTLANSSYLGGEGVPLDGREKRRKALTGKREFRTLGVDMGYGMPN
jgi:hypothetical protein